MVLIDDRNMFLNLKFCFNNVNSVSNKINFIYDLLHKHSIDILALAET